MPHDLNGTPLKNGDHVIIEATIKQVHGGDDYCNLTLETEEPMSPGQSLTVLNLNAKQVTLCRRANVLEAISQTLADAPKEPVAASPIPDAEG